MGAKKEQVRSNPLILANLFPFQLQLWEVNVTVKCLEDRDGEFLYSHLATMRSHHKPSR